MSTATTLHADALALKDRAINSLTLAKLACIHVTEEYIPVNTMGTLLVLLTIDEADVFPDEEEEYEDD